MPINMRIVKVTPILSESDFDNNYVMLFDCDNKFVGFIEKEEGEIEVSLRCSGNKFSTYYSLEALFCVYYGGVIKIVSGTELGDMLSDLNLTK